LLKDIKIVDPAVGSGAFPIGMMNEIVKARSALTTSFNENEWKNRTNYNFKRETIENSLYGVDIDSSAVDIAKLRFWLSLIVDESDITDIQPLPNLDHKIMCGNSLLEEFEGVKLFDEELLGEIPKDNSFELEQVGRGEQKLNQELHEIYTGKKENRGRSKEIKRELEKLKRKRKAIVAGPKEDVPQMTLDEPFQKRKRESQRKLKELKRLQKLFFNEQSRESKRRYRSEIDRIEWELIEETLKEEGNEEAMERLEQYKKNKSKPFFLWKLYFSDVFQRENPGFDVVIANPPYLGQKGNKELFRVLKSSSLGKKFHQRRMDLYYFFFHLSLDLIRLDGIISFITTNYYLTATYADKLRKDFKNRASILKLINFNELKIFESALGQHNMVTILCKRIDPSIIAETALTKEVDIADATKIQDILNKNNYNTDYYCVQQEDLYDGDDLQIRITGLSEISLDPVQKVLNKIRGQGKVLHEICDLNQGIVTGADKVSKNHINKFKVDAQVGDGIFVINIEDIKKLNLNNEELDILKPWFKNSNINKWTTELKTDKRLIYYTSKRSYEHTLNLIKHFEKYKRILINRNVRSGEVTLNDYDKFVRGAKNISYVMVASAFKRGDYYCVSYARDEKFFNSPKIVAPQRTPSNIFGYNEVPWFASADVYFITPKHAGIQLKYVLSLINSKLYYIWLYHMGKRKGEYLELYLKPLSQIPIKIIPVLDQNPFIDIADQILSTTKDDDYPDNPEKQARVKELEKEIDKLVYKLYDLTPEEIDIVENFNKGK
jgi:adenine-specific DNA-methyltransferase